jgi:DNA-binding MarR family transcriptional regulator
LMKSSPRPGRSEGLSTQRSSAVKDAAMLDQCALFDLHRTSRVLTTLYNAHLRVTGMTMAQFTLLRNIAALSPAGVTQIAEAMLMDRTSVTRLVEPLIKTGYLVSKSGESDRRVRNISITAAGRRAIEKSHEAWQNAQQELYDIIGKDQWLSMRRALRDTVHMVRDKHGALGEAESELVARRGS